jgi:hypothetical protein
VRHATCDMRLGTRDSGEAERGCRIWNSALGTWHLALGTWHLALGTWHLALVCGTPRVSIHVNPRHTNKWPEGLTQASPLDKLPVLLSRRDKCIRRARAVGGRDCTPGRKRNHGGPRAHQAGGGSRFGVRAAARTGGRRPVERRLPFA